ncbi:MAG TPA: hypothetical protein VMK12_21725 [Anaeromyxobacteraceae bacterium]|nr:hypothetical protein [Anaeromyxobacteraceae bacterium]
MALGENLLGLAQRKKGLAPVTPSAARVRFKSRFFARSAQEQGCLDGGRYQVRSLALRRCGRAHGLSQCIAIEAVRIGSHLEQPAGGLGAFAQSSIFHRSPARLPYTPRVIEPQPDVDAQLPPSRFAC